MADPYNQYPSYPPTAPGDGGYYPPQDGQYQDLPYQYQQQPYGQAPQEYAYNTQNSPQMPQINAPEGFGGNGSEPVATYQPGTVGHLDPNYANKGGENMDY